MRLIFVPSSVRLYMRPAGSSTKPMTGLTTSSLSIEPLTPTVMIVTEPSTPIFHPALRRNPSSASWVMHAKLETERRRDQIVIALDLLLIEQDALAIFAADADAGLDHAGEYQDPGRLVSKLARARDLADEAVKRLIGFRLEVGRRPRVARARRRGKRKGRNEGEANCLNETVHGHTSGTIIEPCPLG